MTRHEKQIGFIGVGLLLFTLMFIPYAKAADTLLAQEGDVTIRLYQDQCESQAIKDMVDPGVFLELHRSQVTYKTKILETCYMFHEDHVDIVNEQGNEVSVPLGVFRVDEAI